MVGVIGERSVHVEVDAFWQAHFTVLRQASIVSPNIKEHKVELQATNSGRSDTWLAKQHRENFGQWSKEKFLGQQTHSKELCHLAWDHPR